MKTRIRCPFKAPLFPLSEAPFISRRPAKLPESARGQQPRKFRESPEFGSDGTLGGVRRPGYGTSARPHGDSPTGMRATIARVSVSRTVMSFEGPFAV